MSAARRILLPVTAMVAGVASVVALIWGGYSVPAELLPPTIVMNLAVGWSFIGVGVVAWHHAPASRTGLLMVALGFAWFLRFTVAIATAPAFAVGAVLGAVHLSILVHLVVAYPSGRVQTWPQRVIIGVGYLLGAPINIVFLLANPGARPEFDGPPPFDLVILPPDGPVQLDPASLIVQAMVVLLCASVIVSVLLRWRRSSPAVRRITTPAVLGAALIGATILLQRTVFLRLLPPESAVALSWSAQTVLIVWPLALLAGLLRSHLDRGAVGRLLVELESGLPVPDRLRSSLATALHDPTVQIRYLRAGGAGFVDSRGNPVEVGTSDGRAVTYLERDGARIAALDHDASLDAELVWAVAAGAALAVDNERLNAELTAQLREVRQSRSRIVEASDAARRRVERDLHDGSQQRLLGVAIALRLTRGQLASGRTDIGDLVAEARSELGAALEELSALARGIYPAILTEDGLGSALSALAERSPVPATVSGEVPVRLPAAVEQTAYFVVSEALTNAGRHAHGASVEIRYGLSGSTLRVEVSDDGHGGARTTGSGLRGLADRVAAIGGTLSVSSPSGGGTRLVAEMPCG